LGTNWSKGFPNLKTYISSFNLTPNSGGKYKGRKGAGQGEMFKWKVRERKGSS
jgi:hypothetical protein